MYLSAADNSKSSSNSTSKLIVAEKVWSPFIVSLVEDLVELSSETEFQALNLKTKLQDSLKSSSETAGEAFQLIFGKEKPGRVRCMRRVVTPTIIKKNDEIAALKKQHTKEMSSMSRQLKGMEALLRCLMKQNNPELDDEALDNMMSNAMTPRSSESTFLPNHNEQNHFGDDKDQQKQPEDADQYDDII